MVKVDKAMKMQDNGIKYDYENYKRSTNIPHPDLKRKSPERPDNRQTNGNTKTSNVLC